MAPVGRLRWMHVKINSGSGIQFFERNAHDAGERAGIELRFAMQNLAGDGQRELNDFALDAAVVAGAFTREFVESMADLFAATSQGGIE